MAQAAYRPTCSQCRIYPAILPEVEQTTLCRKCFEREREQGYEQMRAKYQKQAETPAGMPYCSNCLSTQRVFEVKSERGNLGICAKCRDKQKPQGSYPSLAASYATPASPKDWRGPNEIY